MSKGIAVMFKKLFGGVEQLKRQNVPVGGVGVLEREGRFIYYLVTKEKYFLKPTYDSQKSCLLAMKEHCVSHSVHRLAMPCIGCGLDLLQWQQVRQDIRDVFKDTDVHITDKMSLQAAFKTFASKNNNTEATTTDINKCWKDAGVYGKNLTANHTDIAFNKAKVKGAKNLTYNEMDAMIAEMAVKYKDDKKVELDQAISDLKDKLANASSQLHSTTKTMKVGGVDRLTDTSKYTGSHKERFDESGKGKGMSGRENLTDNSGYVGNYKGSGSYDKQH